MSLREIEAIVRYYPASFQPTRIEPLGPAGGMSGAQFWRVECPQGTLVLRQWPREHPTPERLRFIHDVLIHAADRGVAFFAVPIQSAAGESFVREAGHLWELALWMPGVADYERSPTKEKLRSAMRALAGFHKAVSDFDAGASRTSGVRGGSAIARHLDRLSAITRESADVLSRALRDDVWPELAPLGRRFIDMLPQLTQRAIRRLIPLAGVAPRLQPCLRDVWHDHILFTGDEVTGIVDYGGMYIDAPATDVARLLGSLVGDDAAGWREGIAAYSAVQPLSAEEELAATALDASGTILAGCNWLRWIYVEGRKFENRGQVIERFRRIVDRCELATCDLSPNIRWS
jgi:Ser/Thr protein kinase RdoA (MazF antagonist)